MILMLILYFNFIKRNVSICPSKNFSPCYCNVHQFSKKSKYFGNCFETICCCIKLPRLQVILSNTITTILKLRSALRVISDDIIAYNLGNILNYIACYCGKIIKQSIYSYIWYEGEALFHKAYIASCANISCTCCCCKRLM